MEEGAEGEGKEWEMNPGSYISLAEHFYDTICYRPLSPSTRVLCGTCIYSNAQVKGDGR